MNMDRAQRNKRAGERERERETTLRHLCSSYRDTVSGICCIVEKTYKTQKSFENLPSFIIATEYGLEGQGSNSSGDEIFRPSRPALGLTQPPVKWVPSLSRG